MNHKKNHGLTDYYRKLITSRRWRNLRKAKLSDNPLCEMCESKNTTAPASEVHHVSPIENATDAAQMQLLCFNYNNLQSLCHKCHVEAHVELKSKSKASIIKKNKERTKKFLSQFLKR